MSDNLDIWDALSKPPAEHLKKISGGRIHGMTDIKPQWRLQAMTERFGPCGLGWKYTIEKLWTEAGSEGQIAAFAQINLHFAHDGEWSEPIPGIGGSMLVEKEKKGPYTSDECYKMAVTDALSVAMKALGVAADVYLGNWDGSKWKNVEPPKVDPAAVSVPELTDLLGRWKAAFPDIASKAENIRKARFSEWVTEYGGREFDVSKINLWTRQDLDACVSALRQMES